MDNYQLDKIFARLCLSTTLRREEQNVKDQKKLEFNRCWIKADYDVLNSALNNWLDSSDYFPNRKQLEAIYNRIKSSGVKQADGWVIKGEGEDAWVWTTDREKHNRFMLAENKDIEVWARERNLPYPCVTKQDIQAYVDFNKTLRKSDSFFDVMPEPKIRIPTKADLEAAKIKDQTNKEFAQDLMQTDDSLPF